MTSQSLQICRSRLTVLFLKGDYFVIYTFFPIFAAICYALAYILDERILEKINVATFMLVTTIIGLPFSIGIVLFLRKFKNEQIMIEPFYDFKFLMVVIFAFSLGIIGFLFTLFSLQKTNAVYTSFAEISYPLFTVLILFLFFGARQFNPTILLGGTLVLLGSFILIYGQSKIVKP